MLSSDGGGHGEGFDAVAAVLLGEVEGFVGGFDELLGRRVVEGLAGGDADADGQGDGGVRDGGHGFGEGFHHALGHDVCAGQVGFSEQDGELLTAVADDEVAGAMEPGGQRVGGVLEALVADEVAVGVVEELEVIAIRDEQGEGAAGAMGAAPLMLEAHVEAAAVGDAGEAVLHGELLEAVAGVFELELAFLEMALQEGGADAVDDEGTEEEAEGELEVMVGDGGAEGD